MCAQAVRCDSITCKSWRWKTTAESKGETHCLCGRPFARTEWRPLRGASEGGAKAKAKATPKAKAKPKPKAKAAAGGAGPQGPGALAKAPRGPAYRINHSRAIGRRLPAPRQAGGAGGQR